MSQRGIGRGIGRGGQLTARKVLHSGMLWDWVGYELVWWVDGAGREAPGIVELVPASDVGSWNMGVGRVRPACTCLICM